MREDILEAKVFPWSQRALLLSSLILILLAQARGATAQQPASLYTYIDGSMVPIERHAVDSSLYRIKGVLPVRYMRPTGKVLVEFTNRVSESEAVAIEQRFHIQLVRRLPAEKFVLFAVLSPAGAVEVANKMHESGAFVAASAEWVSAANK